MMLVKHEFFHSGVICSRVTESVISLSEFSFVFVCACVCIGLINYYFFTQIVKTIIFVDYIYTLFDEIEQKLCRHVCSDRKNGKYYEFQG